MTMFEDWERERDREQAVLMADAEERVSILRTHARDPRPGCEVAFIRYSLGGRPFAQRCEDAHLCEACEDRAERAYPQGWRHYPGDTCRHGTYVGGIGVDWMCGRCEDGD